MGGVDIVALMAFGGNRLLGDLAGGDKPAPAGAKPTISASEQQAASRTMSRMFD